MSVQTVSEFGLGFSEPIAAVVIGGRGGLGEAFVSAIAAAHPLRKGTDITENKPLPNRKPLGRPERAVARDALDLRELPLLVAEGADASGFEPALDAVQMEDVAAAAEGDREAVLVVRRGVRLIFYGRLVERVPADGAGVGADVPGPHADLCE